MPSRKTKLCGFILIFCLYMQMVYIYFKNLYLLTNAFFDILWTT